MSEDSDLTIQAIMDLGVSKVDLKFRNDTQRWEAVGYAKTKQPRAVGTGDSEASALESLLTSVGIDKKANPDAYQESDGGAAEMVSQDEGTEQQEISTTGAIPSAGDRGQATGG